MTATSDYYFTHHYPYKLMICYISSLGTRRAAIFPSKGGPRYFTADDIPKTEEALRKAMTHPVYVGSGTYPTSFHMDFFVPVVDRLGTGHYSAEPVRELVIDLDLKDWPQRHLLCGCSDKSACSRCWLLVELSALTTRCWLGDVVGLGPMLAVFSGGKGVHFAFASPAARSLRLCDRVKLFDLLESTSKNGDPTIEGIKRTAVDLWVARGIIDRDLLVGERGDTLAQFLRDHFRVRDPFPDTAITSLDRWRFLESKTRKRLILNTIWTHFARPVIDTQVTLEKVHLLKTPFSLHGSTGRIALPIPLDALRDVDPSRMPVAGDAGLSPQFRTGCDTLRQWLLECGYF